MTVYANPFTTIEWPNNAAGLVFNGSDIHEDTTSSGTNLSYGWFYKLVPFLNLNIELDFNLRVSGDSSFSGPLFYNGIAVYGDAADISQNPVFTSGKFWGAFALRTAACGFSKSNALIGYNGASSEYNSGCVVDTSTQYSNCIISISITIGSAPNKYNVSCGLQIPALSIDETRTQTDYFDTGSDLCRIAIAGSYIGNADNADFKVNSLIIITSEIDPPTAIPSVVYLSPYPRKSPLENVLKKGFKWQSY